MFCADDLFTWLWFIFVNDIARVVGDLKNGNGRHFLTAVCKNGIGGSHVNEADVAATQREKALPVLMKQFSLNQEDVGFVYDIVQKGFALDGRPTPGSQKFEFDLAQKEMGLKEPPRPEQVYDFSLLDEVAAAKR